MQPASLLQGVQDTDADGKLLFGSAPPAIQDVISWMGGLATPAQSTAAAAASNKAGLRGFERREAAVGHDSAQLAPGVVPAGPVDFHPEAPGWGSKESQQAAERSAQAATLRGGEQAVPGNTPMPLSTRGQGMLPAKATRGPPKLAGLRTQWRTVDASVSTIAGNWTCRDPHEFIKKTQDNGTCYQFSAWTLRKQHVSDRKCLLVCHCVGA